MTTKSLEAWVIHKQWSGDTSARVTFFTREAGLLNCLCKGGRTPKKQSLLQPFTSLWLSVDERYNHYYTRTVESAAPILHLEGNSLFSGLYLNELLYHALRPMDADSNLFDAYLLTLNSLTLTQERLKIERFLRRFEWVLLNACGHSFSLTEDARSGEDVIAHAYYQFVAGEGIVLCNKGIPGEHLLALAEDNLDEPLYLKSAKIIMRQAIDHLVGGKEIKARSLYSIET
ncbi:DNA repair protein RecO [Legionella shakespearei]|uniref:DNA repair protein RecO n=1 Tax=Legionella shakespearei DSM 23087 TaxID=1122169 RepID=A0A0W0YMQ7_9GAMM|nr:DNA repair protein RecO [Legionella shakespearei]KTD57918.1 DNA repair protein recO [Legionella shakespearei DSM 23087]